jgi:dTDP-glucose 4,6-dehydratase
MLLELLGRDDSFVDYVQDRPGHDRRYAVDSSKLRALGWSPQHSIEDRLATTVAWYADRRDWWQPLKGGKA